MKAKLSNGEIVEVLYYSQDPITKEIYSISYGKTGDNLTRTDLFEILPDEPVAKTASFDWESFRNETAAKAMQAFLSNQEMAERLEQNGEFFHDLASDSIGLADELIKQLKAKKP